MIIQFISCDWLPSGAKIESITQLHSQNFLGADGSISCPSISLGPHQEFSLP